MIQSVILIEGKNDKTGLGLSLSNAKQIVIGKAPGFGMILHVAAMTPADLGKALLKFAQVPGVTGVVTLALRTP